MISGLLIKKYVKKGKIQIAPFSDAQCQPHSYDLRLGEKIVKSKSNITWSGIPVIDTHRYGESAELKTHIFNDRKGYILEPGKLYLGHTVEVVGTDKLAPRIDTRSTAARFGIPAHLNAGFCDAGWYGQIVLEIFNFNEYPVIIYPGDRICQIYFEKIQGRIDGYKSTYQNQRGIKLAKSLAD